MSTWVAEIERLQTEVRRLTRLLDDQLGTPCEQIRHQQEIERLEQLIAFGVDMRIALAKEKNAEIERLRAAPYIAMLESRISDLEDKIVQLRDALYKIRSLSAPGNRNVIESHEIACAALQRNQPDVAKDVPK